MTQASDRIGFIGAGNMAKALVGGLINHGYPAEAIGIYDINNDAKLKLAQQYKVRYFSSNYELYSNSDISILAIKPQHIASVCQEISEQVKQLNYPLISIAAGITIAKLQQYLNASPPVIRCMPNTPALIGKGVSVLFASPEIREAQRASAIKIFESVGKCYWVEQEHLLNAVTAISGSGPAYFFYFMELIIDNAVNLGLPQSLASKLVLNTALGSAELALTSDDLKMLRHNVTSPGGTTEAALNEFQHEHFKSTIERAIMQACKKAEFLSEASS